LRIKPNLTQNAAISFLCVFDDHEEKIQELALKASVNFDVQVIRELSLLTIRHFNETIKKQLIDEKKVLLTQQTAETLQVVLKDY
jgi:aspartate kinase